MTDDRRKRGRPRSLEPGSRVTVWITAAQHDALVKQAQRTDQSLSKTLRDQLQLQPPRRF